MHARTIRRGNYRRFYFSPSETLFLFSSRDTYAKYKNEGRAEILRARIRYILRASIPHARCYSGCIRIGTEGRPPRNYPSRYPWCLFLPLRYRPNGRITASCQATAFVNWELEKYVRAFVREGRKFSNICYPRKIDEKAALTKTKAISTCNMRIFIYVHAWPRVSTSASNQCSQNSLRY